MIYLDLKPGDKFGIKRGTFCRVLAGNPPVTPGIYTWTGEVRNDLFIVYDEGGRKRFTGIPQMLSMFTNGDADKLP